MGKSSKRFLDQREAEWEYEDRVGSNWIEPIPYPWLSKKQEAAKEVREKPDDPIAEHDFREFEMVEEQNKNFEQDNPRE